MLKLIHQLGAQLWNNVAVLSIFAAAVSGCSPQPSRAVLDTWINVPDSDWSLWNENGKSFTPLNSPSYERAYPAKLTYKDLTFHPQLEKQQIQKEIKALRLGNLLTQFEVSHAKLTRLEDGRVLASGGEVRIDGLSQPTATLAILDPKTKTVTKLGDLKVPRTDDAVLQLRDKRVIFIGGETTKEFADDGTDNLTDTVEQLDLRSGKSQVIGKINVARHGVIAELLGDRDILIVGGWNERQFARDERWWPGAEIFRVPPKEKIIDNHK